MYFCNRRAISRSLKTCAAALSYLCLLAGPIHAQPTAFDPFDATIPQIEAALKTGSITCQQLVQYYFTRMDALDASGPKLNSVRARNPQALQVAAQYDAQPATAVRGPLYCIPVVVKDNINTTEMPTTAGSVALQGSVPSYDAFLVTQLKAAGAIIVAKANMTEYANYLTAGMPAGYSSLGGYVLNPYDPQPAPTGDGRQALTPSGSSAGPGVIAAANLAAVTVGTETSGSILSPANANSDVGIKPTVGLISRHGVIPIAASQDTAGPITRTVTDAAILLGAMTGVDGNDSATSSQIGLALSDYTPWLKANGLSGARIGVPAEYWSSLAGEQLAIAQKALAVMQSQGATIVNCNIASFTQLGAFSSSVLSYEFKRDLDAYLATLGPNAPVKSLADVVAFNNAHAGVALKYGQTLAIASQALDLKAAEPKYEADRAQDLLLAKVQGIDATMSANQLTAVVFAGSGGAGIAAKAGYPSVIVPAGYLSTGSPYGIMFTGGAYSEGTLISLAYSFEQATKIRRDPPAAFRVLPVSPTIQPSGIVSYATGASGAIAPGEFVAITGSGLGTAQPIGLSVANGRITSAAGSTRVLFDGVPAPIISAQANQIIAIVPYATYGKVFSQVNVEYNGARSDYLTAMVTPAVPGIFTSQPLGQGSPVIINSDGTVNSASSPAKKGTYISFYATGEGIPQTLGVDGRLAAAAPYQTPLLPVTISIGGATVPALYAGAAPGYAGMMQVNAQLTTSLASGPLALTLSVGASVSQTATVFVQ